MAGLLDFALGFGAGAAKGVAETSAMNIQNRAEEVRMRNLERLRAQYRSKEIEQQADAQIRVAQETAKPVAPDIKNWQTPSGELLTVDMNNPPEVRAAREQGAVLQRGTGNTINFNENKLTPLQEAMSTREADRIERIIQSADAAAESLPQIQRARAALESGSFETGAFGEQRAVLSEFARFVGVNPESIPALKLGSPETASTLRSAISNLAVSEAQGMGRNTNMALNLIVDSLGSLNRTPEANKVVFDVMERVANRKIELANLAETYYNDYGSLTNVPEGVPTFTQASRQLEQENPVMSEDLLDRVRSVTNTGRDVRVPAALQDAQGNPVPTEERFNALINITSEDQFMSTLDRIDRAVLINGVNQLIQEEQLDALPRWQRQAMLRKLRGQ